jgi:hypothetical protein
MGGYERRRRRVRATPDPDAPHGTPPGAAEGTAEGTAEDAAEGTAAGTAAGTAEGTAAGTAEGGGAAGTLRRPADQTGTGRGSDHVGGARAGRAGGGTRTGGGAPAEDREQERGLRGLVGSGSSQVSVGAALRARDAARPTDADLAEAAEQLVIVRRNWQPREELPKSR